MTESRLQRWSRKKSEAGKQAEPAPPPSVESGPSPEEQELAINQALPEQEVLEKYGLPDPDAIELGTDITGFMRNEIPDLLRRRALRALWKSNPVLAVLDGLNDYDEDFSDAATATRAVETLYKVGQGLIDRSANAGKQVDEEAAEPVTEQAEAPVTITPPEHPQATGRPEPGIADVPPNGTHHAEPAVTETEVEPATRYRPRMRFDVS